MSKALDLPDFMLASPEELFTDVSKDETRPWWIRSDFNSVFVPTADELTPDLSKDDSRPWFMRASVKDVLKPTIQELLGGRENEIDVFTGGKGYVPKTAAM